MRINAVQRLPSRPGTKMLYCAVWAVVAVAVSNVWADEGHGGTQAAHTHVLVVGNESGETITLSPREFAELPRSSIRAKIPHTEQTVEYEGVLLAEILQEAGMQVTDPSQPAKKLPGVLRYAYVLVEAADGYQVLFSIPEVFPESPGHEILLADRKNGEPLDAKARPYQVIVAGSNMFERWVRQVTRILVQPATASPFPSRATAGPKPIATKAKRGQVYLVGTGPGAPDLITARAANVLQSADLVFCFSWMKDELASFVRPDIVEVASPVLRGGQYCGRKPDEFSEEVRDRVIHTNEELENLKTRLRVLVAEGKTVVFADNGDPMVFSPWSWIPQHLGEFRFIRI